MRKLLKFLNNLLDGFVIVIVSAMCLSVFLNVVLRYVFNSGLTWSEELARYLFVWTVFLGAVVAAKDKGHLAVDLLVGILPRKLQRIAYVLSNIAIIVVLGLLVDGLIKMMELNKGITGPGTGLPVGLLYFAGLFAAVCMIIISIVQSIQFGFFDRNSPPWVKEGDEEEGGAKL
ncbi:TRAP transporter small permease [Geobacillus subterraneus]|uniref:TRAP transporter small permease n=1 Tax=Geobacillus subterraneus TaxID=129338 RepID=UPI00067AAD4D|nr:TRAP transporter small permease [Geobacillus subterraneus]AKU25405.1 C4-dicarboxylate ABC transporter permease [Geobacillus sp. LC300]KZM58879.1 C4-dicarboxylate ABC transporter permease [Geobacillus stearothermophilus]WPZ16944.1 TRAP transporter small permease [Geobacillus subterraneus]